MASVITSISGLQNLPNLTNFDADFNGLIAADFSGLTNLNYIDISDCDLPNGSNSLTSIDVTGCSALTSLRADDSDFSELGLASIVGFGDLVNLELLDLDQCGLSGTIDLTGKPALYDVDLGGNVNITAVNISSSQPIADFSANNNALTQASVDAILIALSTNGINNGYVSLDGGTNAAPSSIGSAAKEVLQENGWTVYVNQAPPASVGIAASTDFDIVGDFTIEMFINMANTAGVPRTYSFGVYPAANAISIEDGTVYFWGNAGARTSGSFSPTIGEWYHLCVMRSNDDLYIFNNGTVVSTNSYPNNILSLGLPLTIGDGNEPNSSFNGLMSNFRWTSSAVYPTTGFTTPTTPLTDLTDTKLLIFQGTSLSAQLTDNSGNNHNGTASGAVYNASSPFAGVQGSLQVGVI